jgi:hypothetical protein
VNASVQRIYWKMARGLQRDLDSLLYLSDRNHAKDLKVPSMISLSSVYYYFKRMREMNIKIENIIIESRIRIS